MKNAICRIGVLMAIAMGSLELVSMRIKEAPFDTSNTITRYTRETSSTIRDSFFTTIDFKAAISDNTIIKGATLTADDSDMISLLNNDLYGIGYISYAALESSELKALIIEGVRVSEKSIIDDSYKLSRNFNYITKAPSDLSEKEYALITGFIAFSKSREGLSIIKAKDGIVTQNIEEAESFTTLLAKSENSALAKMLYNTNEAPIHIKLGGSKSVESISRALSSAFTSLVPAFKAVHNYTSNEMAYEATQGSNKDSAEPLHIGFLARDLDINETEPALAGSYGVISKDAIIAVVSNKNHVLSDITRDQLKQIYKSETITWSALE